MALKCPACGATIVYNPKLGRLKCEYCDSEFDADEYSKNNEAKKSNENSEGLKVDTYSCNNCGAELHAPENQIVAYCMYCGGQSTLLRKADIISRPSKIAPFEFSKKLVKEDYKAAIQKQPFVPKDFHNPEFIEGFRGIYIPYWSSKAKIETQNIVLNGETNTVEGGYDYKRTYDYTVKVFGECSTGSYDASENFDDTIAADIAPFYENKLVDFKESYLAGYYADKADVEIETYNGHINEEFTSKMVSNISEVSGNIETPKDVIKNSVKYASIKKESVLYPVWFLTWRKGKRVAYSAMNGQTGSLSIDVPVDFFKFFRAAIFFAIAIFAFLNIIPLFILPMKVAAWSSIFLLVSSLVLKKELNQIKLKENHVFDWGYKKSIVEKILPGQSATSKLSSFLTVITWFVIFMSLIDIFDLTTTDHLLKFFSKTAVLQLITCVLQIAEIRKVKSKYAIITIIFALLAQISGFAISYFAFQHDFWHYGIAIACLFGMILNTFTSILYMNFLTTKPVPNFYSREGANNGKKD